MPKEVIFLKLGGSLNPDKSRARRARPDTIRRLVEEIAKARKAELGCGLALTRVWIILAKRRKKHTVGEDAEE